MEYFIFVLLLLLIASCGSVAMQGHRSSEPSQFDSEKEEEGYR